MIGIGSKTSKGKMIMKKTLYFAVSAALVLVACAKEEAPIVNEPTTKNLNTIYASVPETKTTESDAVFSWTASEAIAVGGVESETTQFYNYTCTNIATGAFSGSATDSRKVAVSPNSAASAFAITGETFSYDLSLATAYDTYVSGTTNALMVGEPIESDKYRFSHAAALLKVTYENAPVGTTGLKFTSKNHKISGKKNGIATASSVELTLSDFESTGGNDVTVTLSSSLGETADLVFYIPIPTGTYTGFEFNVNLTGSDAIVSSTAKTVKGSTTIARGDVLSMPVITLAADFTPVTVGPTNNLYWIHGAIADDQDSDAYAINPGEILHIEFVNHQTTNAADGSTNWFNWVLVVANNAYGEEGHFEYFQLRSDNAVENFYFPYNFDNNAAEGLTINVPAADWGNGNFIKTMADANVSISIERTMAGSIFVTAKSVSEDEETTYTETYKQRVSGAGNVVAFLRCFHSYYDIKKVWYSKSKKVLSSLKTAPVFVYQTNIPLATVGVQNQLYAVYEGGIEAPADYEMLTSYGEGEINANGESTPDSPQTFAVTFGGNTTNLSVPVYKGVGEIGTLAMNSYRADGGDKITVANGGNDIKYTYVYSPMTANDQATIIHLFFDNEHSYLAGMDNFVYTLAGTDYGSAWENGKASQNWNTSDEWRWFKQYQNREKVTSNVVNDEGTTAKVLFAAQYACPNNSAEKGNFFQKYKEIPIGVTSFYYRFSSTFSYYIIVDETTALSNGWPAAITEY